MQIILLIGFISLTLKKDNMEPFKVSNHLINITGTYPKAQLILDAAKHGGESTRRAIVMQWLSEGIPYAFKGCPGMYESVRAWMATRLNTDSKKISITGSARLGQSLNPKKAGASFGKHSDLDIFIVSNSLFCKLVENFNAWAFDFESGDINPSNNKELSFWKENLHRGHKNISRGFIDSTKVPNYKKYPHIQNINQTMYLLKRKLCITKLAPKVSCASVRCYRSWNDYIQQTTLNLQ